MRWLWTAGKVSQPGEAWFLRWRTATHQLWVQPDTLGALDVFVQVEGGWFLVQGWLENEAQLRELARVDDRCSLEEVLKALWCAQGYEALSSCRGQLGIAAWDDSAKRFYAWRDALGLVPLFYSARGQARGVSTSASALVASLGLEARPHRGRQLTWLLRDVWEDGQEDFIEGISRVLPGHQLSFDAHGAHVRAWWEPSLEYEPHEDVVGLLESLLRQALLRQGLEGKMVCMSAGVDSSVIAALARDAGPAWSQVLSMVTPSLPTCDESEPIGLLEQALGVRSDRVDVSQWWPGVDAHERIEDPYAGPQFHAGSHEGKLFEYAKREHGLRGIIGGFGADEVLLCVPSLAMRRMWQGAPRTSFALTCRQQRLRWPMLRQATWVVGTDVLGARAMSWLREHLTPKRNQRQRSEAAPWHDASRWVLAQAPPHQVTQTLIHDPSLWSRCRLEMTRSWGWEFFVRTQWRHMLETGLRISSPFLETSLWEALLRQPPEALSGPSVDGAGRTLWWDKLPLRQLMARIGAPEALVWRRKERSFDKLVERGLVLEPASHARYKALAHMERLRGLELVAPEPFGEAFDAFSQAARRQYPAGAHVGSLSIWQALAGERWLGSI